MPEVQLATLEAVKELIEAVALVGPERCGGVHGVEEDIVISLLYVLATKAQPLLHQVRKNCSLSSDERSPN